MGSKSSSNSSTSQQDNTLALGDNEQGYIFHGTGDVNLLDGGAIELAKQSVEGVFDSQGDIVNLAGEALVNALSLTSQTAKSSQAHTLSALSALESQTQSGQDSSFMNKLMLTTALVGGAYLIFKG